MYYSAERSEGRNRNSSSNNTEMVAEDLTSLRVPVGLPPILDKSAVVH